MPLICYSTHKLDMKMMLSIYATRLRFEEGMVEGLFTNLGMGIILGLGYFILSTSGQKKLKRK